MRLIIILIIVGILTINSGCAAVGKGAQWAKDCWQDNKNKPDS